MRSYVLSGDTAHYDGVIAAFESRGLKVIPAFATGLDQRPAIERFFMKNGKPAIDALVSLSGFSLVGGPAYNDAKAAEEMLARARCALSRGTARRVPDAGRMGRLRARAAPDRDHHDDRHPRTRRRHGRRGLRRPQRCGRRASAACASMPSAPRCWPRAWPSSWRCARRRRPSARSPSCCSTSRPMPVPPARRPSSRCSNRSSTR